MVYPLPRNGYVTLTSVLLVGAVCATIVTSLLWQAVGVTRTATTRQQSTLARELADVCAETGLGQIKLSTTFTGSATIVLGGGSCTYTVTNQGGQNRTVDASGSVGAVTRKAKVVVNGTSPVILVSSWQEVSDGD